MNRVKFCSGLNNKFFLLLSAPNTIVKGKGTRDGNWLKVVGLIGPGLESPAATHNFYNSPFNILFK